MLSPDFFIAPSDYGAIVDMVITFPAGETSVTFPVPTEDDNIFEDMESFEGFLSNPSGDVVLGCNNVATVQITDNDRKAYWEKVVLCQVCF